MSAFSAQKWEKLFQNIDLFIQGFGTTLYIVLLGLLLSLVLGAIFGVISTSHNKVLRGIARVYVEFFQNTPLLVQIFFLYNALPYVGVFIPVKTIGIVGVGIYHGAYMAEIVRTGIEATPKGQRDAADSQGFSYVQTMLYIILPQALKVMLPPLTNVAANLIKNTSILAIIAGGDLMYQADSFASSTLAYGPAYVVVGILYFIICFPLARLSGYLEKRFGATPKPKDYTALLSAYSMGKGAAK
ncbi:amino acid ABC transporter permease [Muricomes intestini]|uniref:amino acid ABC transporter permease n=1 Tax=Muricomes intestini TaxID=1796634 RepID=UPI002FE2718E